MKKDRAEEIIRTIQKSAGKDVLDIAVSKLWPYADEPQFTHYRACMADKNQIDARNSGSSTLDPYSSKIKALGEAVERYCLSHYDKSEFIKGTYDEVVKKYPAVNPKKLSYFTKTQENQLSDRYRFNDDSVFHWKKVHLYTKSTIYLIPAQTIYVPYQLEGEPCLDNMISTGAACFPSEEGAIIRGIYEIVERDAYMITYLNRLPRARIDISESKNSVLDALTNIYHRYNLELYIFDITSDIPIPAVMAVIIDRTGIGPAISFGLKSCLSPAQAVIGAVEEAQLCRHFTRCNMYKYGEIINKNKIEDTGERSIIWSNPAMIENMDFLLNAPKKIKISEMKNLDTGDEKKNLQIVLSFFEKEGYEVYTNDITTPCIKKTGLFVYKCVIPSMQPLYIHEPPPKWGCQRLYSVPKILGFLKEDSKEEDLYRIPHPFH
jgi:ribosomal protein S12 methylthiotransferase accessory factor